LKEKEDNSNSVMFFQLLALQAINPERIETFSLAKFVENEFLSSPFSDSRETV
jgi:hypothetical protein